MATNTVQYIIDIVTGTAKKNLHGLEKSVEDLNRDLERTEKVSKNTKKEVGVNFETLKAKAILGSAAIAAFTTATFKATTKVVDLVNNLNDLSVRSGLATDTIQALEQAMRASGQPAEGLNEILNAMAGQFAQLSKEGSEVEKKFKTFGIAVKESNGDLRSNNDILLDIITQLQGIKDNSERSRRAVFLLGESGAKLNQALASGEFKEFLDFTKEFGVKTGVEASKQAAQFQSALAAMGTVLNGTIQQFVNVTGLQERFVGLIVETGSKLAFMQSLMTSLNKLFRGFSDLLFKLVFIDIYELISILGDLAQYFISIIPNSLKNTTNAFTNKLTKTFDDISKMIFGPFTKAFDFAIDIVDSYLTTISKMLNELARTIGDFIGFDEVIEAFEKATDAADRYKERSLAIPDLSAKSSVIVNNLNDIEGAVNQATDSLKTLNNILDDFFSKFTKFDVGSFIASFAVVFVVLNKKFNELFDASKIDRFANTLRKKLFGQAQKMADTSIGGFGEITIEATKFTGLQEFLAKMKLGLAEIFSIGIKGLGKAGNRISSALSGGLSAGATTALTGVAAVIGIVKNLGKRGDSPKEIQKSVEQDIRATAKGIEMGLRVLPGILFETLPPLLLEFVDRLVFGFLKGIAEQINLVINAFKSIFTREGRQERKEAKEKRKEARGEEFERRLGVLFDIISKRSGGRYIPSARGGIKFTGQDEGLAMLHRGEYVVPETGQAPQGVQRTMMGMGSGGVTININAHVVESNAVDELVRQIERRFQAFGSSTSPLFGGS